MPETNLLDHFKGLKTYKEGTISSLSQPYPQSGEASDKNCKASRGLINCHESTAAKMVNGICRCQNR